MRFVDECEIVVVAGNGGAGAVAFRREKYQPFGGPSGGDGGRGGHVYFEVDRGLSTLVDLQHRHTVKATRGQNGQGRDCYGAAGDDITVRLPPGTLVFDRDTGDRLMELTEHGARVIIAQGGAGGQGNLRFATAIDRAPRRAEPGGLGQERRLRLELKLMADVGLLGYPNVGKSTLIRSVSRAKPKVADYPFTTLEPHLGVVSMGDHSAGLTNHFVMADIPGLIPGASEGAGLGIQFLRHLERTRLLLHLVTCTEEPGRHPLRDYDTLREELQKFNPDLAQRREVVVLSKLDLTEVRDSHAELTRAFEARGIQLHAISAATHEGIAALVRLIAQALQEEPHVEPVAQGA